MTHPPSPIYEILIQICPLILGKLLFLNKRYEIRLLLSVSLLISISHWQHAASTIILCTCFGSADKINFLLLSPGNILLHISGVLVPPKCIFKERERQSSCPWLGRVGYARPNCGLQEWWESKQSVGHAHPTVVRFPNPLATATDIHGSWGTWLTPLLPPLK